MTIELWDWLEELDWAVGAGFPEADEDALLRDGRAWRTLAAELRGVGADATSAGTRVVAALGGDSGAAFGELWRPISAGDGVIERLAQACDELAGACQTTAVEVEYAKLEYIGALVALASTLAWLAAALVVGGVSALGMPAAIAATQLAVRTILLRLLTAVAMGVTFNVAMDAAAQGIQLAEGHRESWDFSLTARAGEDGAIYGAIFGGVLLGAGRLAPGLFRDGAGLVGGGAALARNGAAVLGTTAVAGAIGGVVAPVVHGEAPSLRDVLLATTSSALGAGADLVHHPDRHAVPLSDPTDLTRLAALDPIHLDAALDPALDPTVGSPGGDVSAPSTPDGRAPSSTPDPRAPSPTDTAGPPVPAGAPGPSSDPARGHLPGSAGAPPSGPGDRGVLAGSTVLDDRVVAPSEVADRPAEAARAEVSGAAGPAGPVGAAVAPSGPHPTTPDRSPPLPDRTPPERTSPDGTLANRLSPDRAPADRPAPGQLPPDQLPPGPAGAAHLSTSDYPVWSVRGADPAWTGPRGESLTVGAHQAVGAMLERARTAEPRITGQLRAVADSAGGVLRGEANRLKDPDTVRTKLARLLRGNADLPRALVRLNDTLRYTVELDHGAYADGVRAALTDLAGRGFRPVQDLRRWDPRRGYLGLNTTWSDPVTGHVFEVQFHTPETFAAKTVTHGLYERLRAERPGTQAYQELRREHDAYFVDLPVPPGAPDLGLPETGRHDPTPDLPPPDPLARPADPTPPAGPEPAAPEPNAAPEPTSSEPTSSEPTGSEPTGSEPNATEAAGLPDPVPAADVPGADRFWATDDEARELVRHNLVTTRAGLAFYAPNDDSRVWAAAVRPAPGYVTLDLHGSRRGFQIERGLITPSQLAAALRELIGAGVLDLGGQRGVRLVSCDTGFGGESSPAAQLSRALGVEILAPDQPVWSSLDGSTFVSSPVVVQGMILPRLPPNGSWLRFLPDPPPAPPPGPPSAG